MYENKILSHFPSCVNLLKRLESMSEFRSCYSQSVESSDSSICEVNGRRRFQTSYWPPDDLSADSSISSKIKWYCTGCEGLICESISSGPMQHPQNGRQIDYSFRERYEKPFRNPIVNTPVENMLKAVEVMHRSLNSVEPKRISKDASTSTKHDQKMLSVSVNTDKRQWFAVEPAKVYEYSHTNVPESNEREIEIEKRPNAETLHSFVPDTEKRPSFVVDAEKKQSFMDETSKGPSPIKQASLQSRFSFETQTVPPERNELREPFHKGTSDEGRRDSHVFTNAFNVENRSPPLTRPLFYNFHADSKTDILTLIEKLELAKMRLRQEEKIFEKEASMAKTKRSFFKN